MLGPWLYPLSGGCVKAVTTAKSIIYLRTDELLTAIKRTSHANRHSASIFVVSNEPGFE